MAKHDDQRPPPQPDPDDLFWNGGEPAEPYEPAGGGRHRTGAQEAQGGAESDAGHGWQRFFHEPIRETVGEGDREPYGGRRYAYGREGYFGDPYAGREPTGGEGNYGSLYGRSQRDYAHRRRGFYAPPETGPSTYFIAPQEEREVKADEPRRGTKGAPRQARPTSRAGARRRPPQRGRREPRA